MRITKLFTLLILTFIPSWSRAVSPLAGAVSEDLPNGLRVIVREKHSAPIVSIDIWVGAGAGMEKESESGAAHFLEHCIFKGTTTRRPGEIDSAIEDLGASVNAATGKTYAHFYTSVASKHMDVALDVLADAVQNASFPADEVERERAVILDEMAISRNDLRKQTYIRLCAAAYNNSALGRPVLGIPESLKTISRDTIMGFYRRLYLPNNCKVVIVGDITREAAITAVHNAFGAWRKGEAPDIVPQDINPLQSESLPANSRSSVAIGYVLEDTPSVIPDLIEAMLDASTWGRLDKAFREHKIEGQRDADCQRTAGKRLLMLYAAPDTTHTAEARDILIDQLLRLRTAPPSKNELNMAVHKVLGDWLYETETCAGQAKTLGLYEMMGDFHRAVAYQEALREVTPLQIWMYAKKNLDPTRQVLFFNQAKKNPESISKTYNPSDNPDHRTLVDEQVPTDGNLIQARPQPEKISASSLPTGVKIICNRDPDAGDMVAICVLVKAGMPEENGRAGLGAMTSRALFGSNMNQSEEAVNRSLYMVGGGMETNFTPDYTMISCVTTVQAYEEAFRSIGEALKTCQFGQQTVERARISTLDEIDRETRTPQRIAYSAAREILYRSGPYRQPIFGITDIVRKLTAADLRRFYQQNYLPKNTVVSIIGNISAERAIRAVENQLLPDYDRQSPVRKASVIPTEVATNPGQVERRFDGNTACVLCAFAGPTLKHSDYPAFKVLSAIIGGGKSARLFKTIRDQKGIGYSVASATPHIAQGSDLLTYVEYDPIRMGTDGKPLSLDTVKSLLVDTTLSVLQTPPTSHELERAIRYVVGSDALAHERLRSRAFYPAFYELLGSGASFEAEFTSRLEGVTLQDIERVAKKYLVSPAVAIIRP